MEYDFSGYATKNDLLCSDGRVIMRDAFKDNDGAKVPLVWNHGHGDVKNVLGHAYLENRNDGVYAYGFFNESPEGQHAKQMVQNHDIEHLSIFANKLKHNGRNVTHGMIREVSLVMAGANPGAYIDYVIQHGEESDEMAEIFTDEYITLHHSDEGSSKKEGKKMSGKDDKTIKDVFDDMTDEQKTVVYALVGAALEDEDQDEEDYEDEEDEDVEHSEYYEGDEYMKHNVFDQDEIIEQDTLSHSEVESIFADGKRYGSLRDSFLAHAEEYGIQQIDWLFPEAREINRVPEFIKRDTNWVQKVISGTHHVPFSRIKTTFADITADEARAKGYFKGNLKKEEVFTLLKRTTTPTTIYKKQKMDRDDVIDITDFDVVAWLKSEMRMMLDEEIARAILIGDGRLTSSDDKINEQNIRPIIKDEELFTIQATVDVANKATADDKAKEFIRTAIKARKDYKGTGQPTLFTTEDMLTDMLLLTDMNGRDLYESEAKLATKLRVKEIVVVPVMEGVVGKNGKPLMGVIVNLADYDNGADKGGAINMFDDFDIDYNQQKYLIETRCSGALVKPFSAIALTLNEATA